MKLDINELPEPTKDNSLDCMLHRECKTTTIFDEFTKPQYNYLIVKWFGTFKTKIRYHLLVSKIPFYPLKNIDLKTPQITASKLKEAYLYSDIFRIKNRKEIRRKVSYYEYCSALIGEVYSVFMNTRSFSEGDILYFENPCELGAQSSAFRYNFGRQSAAINNEYGETMRFAIIGIVIGQCPRNDHPAQMQHGVST